MTMPFPFAGKVALELSDQPPTCPWCDGLLNHLHWHKVTGGPRLPYIIVLSCPGCRAVLECLAGGGRA